MNDRLSPKRERPLPERADGRSGARACTACVEKHLRPVRMDFQRYDGWNVTFYDRMTEKHLPRKLTFATEDKLYQLVATTYQPAEALRELDQCVTAWARGSVDLRLTAVQYGKLMVSR